MKLLRFFAIASLILLLGITSCGRVVPAALSSLQMKKIATTAATGVSTFLIGYVVQKELLDPVYVPWRVKSRIPVIDNIWRDRILAEMSQSEADWQCTTPLEDACESELLEKATALVKKWKKSFARDYDKCALHSAVISTHQNVRMINEMTRQCMRDRQWIEIEAIWEQLG